MRIAQVTPVYPPYKGGMGSVAYEYTERLKAFGQIVEVFTPAWKIGNAGFLSFKQLRAINQCDVVHLHYPFYGGAEMLALFCRKPIVCTYHMDATASGIKGAIFSLHRWLLQPFVLWRAVMILVSSLDYAKSSALRRWMRGNRVHELSFGVDIRRFHPVATEIEAELRQRAHIPAKVPILLFVGGLDQAHAFKGLSVLLSAFATLADTSAHLLIVGDGNRRSAFEAEAKQLPYASRIHFAGAVSQEDLPAYYRLVDVHVFPSTSPAEAFGLVALEAAASGIPTIASNLPGVRTVVQDEQTGLLVTPNNPQVLKGAIERLLNDSALREKLGNAARKRAVETYDWEKLHQRLVGFYEDCHHH